MRKLTALWNFTLLVSLVVWTPAAPAAAQPQHVQRSAFAFQWNAPPQAAAPAKNWKSRDEYDAYTAMANEKDPNKKIALAEAFLQKYANSDFKDGAYMAEEQAYQQLQATDKAVDAAHKVLEANPNQLNQLEALRFLSFVFPFVYKGDDPDAPAKLSRAESDATRGLEVLQKLQKPAGASDEQFNQGVKGLRAIFNGTVGFGALQRKDYAAAITSYKAAAEDNQNDWYVFYRMGLAYLYSNPHDYDHAIWYIARAYDLAKAAPDPNAAEFEKYLRQTYINYHGNDQGLQDIETQAAASVNPPDGFKVTAMEAPKPTGNPLVDAFNTMTYPLKFGGETAQKQWDGLKGQPLELGGVVGSVEKGSEAGTNLVRICILDQTKATPGTYDIEVKDTKQPNVKNLAPGDAVRFKGVMDSYTATPNVILTVVGEITQPDPLPDKPPAKEKPKTTRKTTRKPAPTQ
jgi:tetratricopeptide (TPR) repeat protein